MTAGNRNKRSGDRYELEAQALVRDLLGLPDARRALGAGRQDDIGDIHAVPDTVIQVAGTIRDDHISTVAKAKLSAAEIQRQRAGVRHSAVWLRIKGGEWRVLVDLNEAGRLGLRSGILAPDKVPAAVAVRYFPVVRVDDRPVGVVDVARLEAFCMMAPTWATYWSEARHAEFVA